MASPPPSAMDTFASLDTSWTLPLDTSRDAKSASRRACEDRVDVSRRWNTSATNGHEDSPALGRILSYRRSLPLRRNGGPVDIAVWLADLGLERYKQAFDDNDVDGEMLCRLTGDDLKEIGIASLGHRKKLLEAIAGLNDSTGPAASLVRDACERGETARRRAPPVDGDVRRPGRVDRAFRQARSRGHARDHPALSEHRSGRNHAVRGSRREIHGRRRACLFRLAEGA